MKKIGTLSTRIEKILHLNDIKDRNIYLGESNIVHMQKAHPKDYEKYKDELSNILAFPDYVGINKKDLSIEYVKEFVIDNEFVKVAVRVSGNEKLFARSMYVLNNKRVQNFIEKKALLAVDMENDL